MSAPVLNAILAALSWHRFDESSEARLQDGIEAVLRAAGFAYLREARLSERDRIDFLVDGVGIEAKVDGASSEVLRQVHRYACLDAIQGIVVVTTKRRHRLPLTLQSKPIRVVYTRGWCA